MAADALDDAMSSTPASTGPTHGVHAKLNVKPSTSATSGFMANAVEPERQPPLGLHRAHPAERAQHVQAERHHDQAGHNVENARWLPVNALPQRREAEPQQGRRRS